MKVTENLYAYLWPGLTFAELMRYGNNSNSYVIADSIVVNNKRCHIIVDPGHLSNERGTDCLNTRLEEMVRDGIEAHDIGLVLNTHWHADHCQASQYFKSEHKALVAIGKLEASLLRSSMPEIEPDIYLSEGDLNLDDAGLKIIDTPGHSPGAISIYWPKMKALFTGDVIFYENTGRVDIAGASGDQLRESIEKLAKLKIEYLLTGHQYEAPGIIQGQDDIKANFDFVKRHVFPLL